MRVRLANSSFHVRIGKGSSFSNASGLKVRLGGGGGSGSGGSDVERLSELSDVNITNLTSSTNRFVLVYDAPTSSFKFVNPDEVIDAAVGSGTVPGGAPAAGGLSDDSLGYIENEMDDRLDNKIDLDAGTF
tara:strand:- start:35 stop:427 length:393 start_codon:yes stop_codon:yes gene_type:complete